MLKINTLKRFYALLGICLVLISWKLLVDNGVFANRMTWPLAALFIVFAIVVIWNLMAMLEDLGL